MRPTLDFLQALALQAGAILRAGQAGVQVGYKGEIDLVTEMDHRSEAYLLGEIRRNFPQHAIVAEESGLQEGSSAGRWLVDPLDGTVNYAHGLPIYSVSVAYEEDGQALLGVVYQPALNECFAAERGRGAWLNNQAIHISTQTALERSLLVTGFPYDIRTTRQTNLDNYARFALRSQAVRRFGSAAVDCCYVACGRFDGYWELDVRSYDIAAGALIAEEAGAHVTTVDGNPHYLHFRTSMLAAGAAVHAQMLAVLQEQ